MFRHTPLRSALFSTLTGLSAALLITAQNSDAASLSFDFNGNSGTTPSGWNYIGFDALGSAGIVESETVVTIGDGRSNGGPNIMQSSSFGGVYNFTLDVEIASMTSFDGSEPETVIGIGSFSNFSLLVAFNASTQALRVDAFGAASGSLSLGNLTSYSGGAISIGVIGDNDDFLVSASTATESYNSGFILYSALGATGFDSIDDLGTAPTLLLGTESAGSVPNGTLAEIAYDSIVLNATSIPEPSHSVLMLLGLTGIVLRRRR